MSSSTKRLILVAFINCILLAPACAPVQISDDQITKASGNRNSAFIPIYNVTNTVLPMPYMRPAREFEVVSSIKVRDSGLSTNSITWQDMQNTAREKGGDAVLITKATPPDGWSTIWRWDFDIISFTDEVPKYSGSKDFTEVVDTLRNSSPVTPTEAMADLSGIWEISSSGTNSPRSSHGEFALLPSQDPRIAYYGYNIAPLKLGVDAFSDTGVQKVSLEETASKGVYIASYSNHFRHKISDTIVIDNPVVFELSGATRFIREDTITYQFVRKTPKISDPGIPAENDGIASGTGVFITKNGLLVTAAHVIEDKKHFSLSTAFGVIDKSEVSIIKIDTPNDLALLRVNSPELESKLSVIEFPPLRSSLGMQIGEPVFLLGYPLTNILGEGLRFSSGEISATFGVQSDPRMLQFSAAVHPGNSGGPLFDSSGAIVGIVVSTLSPIATWRDSGSLPQNVNFAIKADILKQLTEQAGYNVPLVSPSSSDFVPAPPSVIESAKKLVLRVIAE